MTLRGHHSKSKEDSGNPANYNGKIAGQRHGSTESSGAESWMSTDTVKGPFDGMKISTINTVQRKLGYV